MWGRARLGTGSVDRFGDPRASSEHILFLPARPDNQFASDADLDSGDLSLASSQRTLRCVRPVGGDVGSGCRVHNKVSVALPKRTVSTILARANQSELCRQALRGIVVIGYCGADGINAGLLNNPIDDRSRCLSGVSLPPSVFDQTPSNLHVTIGARWPLQVDRSHHSVGTPLDDDTDAPRKLVAIGPQRPEMP